jgi:hypothetical protein
VVAWHATDPASVFLSGYARTARATVEGIENALYVERSLIRMLGMRRTMFVAPVELAPVIQAACADDVARTQAKRYAGFLERSGTGDAAFLAEVADATERALARRGEASGNQLAADEPRLRTRVMLNEGKSYGGEANITTWVLILLAAQGRIVRGRPGGAWTSSQWRWSPMSTWLPAGMPQLTADVARAELVRSWLAAFGPGTVEDLRWWTGLTLGQVRKAVGSLEVVEVDLDGRDGLVLAGDDEPVADPAPWVALLPALDPTPMGWAGRDWYLGPHAPALFDRSGNIGPTVWSDGKIVGGWAQRPDGRLAMRLLEDVGRQARAAVGAELARLQDWLGPVRVKARFRTPLESELAAST